MDSSDGGLTVRSMKLKVLYTFDTEHKHSHLARWPQTLDIKTLILGENNYIGVIDLRTCLEAVTSASPELVSNNDNDFTIYAVNYTEEDAPLESQGSLSSILEGIADADEESEKMVSGRVTKNTMGMFSGNALDTLEVKLRLTPFSTTNYNTNSRQRRYSISSNSGQEFPSQSRQSNAGLAPPSRSNEFAPRSASPTEASGFEALQQMVSGGGFASRERAGSQMGDSFATRSNSRPPSRVGTPTPGQPFSGNNARQAANSGSRPSSRAGMWQPTHGRRDSFNSGYFSGEENQEEGPSRKRAKIASVEYRTANHNIQQQPDSLRVAASTASSVRIHRPVAVNPALALQTGTSAEEPVRPPTPVANKAPRPRGRPPKRFPSSLHNRSQVRTSSPSTGPAERQVPPPESTVSSPEDVRAASISSTPADIPSSPPVMHDNTTYPTSPILPTMPAFSIEDDSGFMDGNFDEYFMENDTVQFDDFINMKADESNVAEDNTSIPQLQEERQVSESSSNTYPAYPPVFEEGNDVEKQAETKAPQKTAPKGKAVDPTYQMIAPAPPALSRSNTTAPAGRYCMSSPKLAPIPRYWGTEREAVARANLPSIPASDPASRPLHRSNTWAGDMSDILTSDALIGPEPKEPKPKPPSKKRPGRDQTRQRLETAISSGIMPPFCDNCGCIETPAWRRAYSREFEGSEDQVETSLEDGACVFKQVTERHPDGSCKRFKGYKVTKKLEDRDDEWIAISLCNPCGLWFHKQKCMRPEAKWNKKDKDAQEKKKRKYRPKNKPRAAHNGGANAASRSDAATPASEGSSPAYTATEPADDAEESYDITGAGGEGEGGQLDSNEPELPPLPRPIRASSAEPVASRGFKYINLSKKMQAAGRQVQSSPIRHRGSDKEAIDIDLTSHPLRRQLFPSPNKGMGIGQLDHLMRSTGVSVTAATAIPSFLRRSPRLNKTKDALFSLGDPFGADKENVVMTINDDGLGDLFDGGVDDVHLPPSTPTLKRRSERLTFKTPLKTPSRNPGAEISPNLQRSGGRHPAAAAFLGTVKKTSEMTPFTRSIHGILSDGAHYGRTSPSIPGAPISRTTPKQSKVAPMVDFPDLPPLGSVSPMSNDPLLNFNIDFSEMTTDQLQQPDFNTDFLSTDDNTYPSSPPPGFLNFPPNDNNGMANVWSEMEMDVYGQLDMRSFEYPDPTDSETFHISAAPQGQLRRSPRKKQQRE